MELTNTYHLAASVAQAWTVLACPPRAAACLPGAVLAAPGSAGTVQAAPDVPAGAGPAGTSGAGATESGVLHLAVNPGPYEVEARVAEADNSAHWLLVTAEGTPGLTAVRVTAVLRPWGSGTELSVLTDLTLSGRLARLGPGVVAAAASRLLGTFAANLETAAARVAPDTAVTPPATAPGPSREIPARRLAPGTVAAAAGTVAAGTVAGLVMIARRLAAARK